MLDKALYQFGRPVVGLYARIMLKMDVERHAPLPAGPKIIAPNHPSTTDPFLITLLCPEHTTILIKETLFKVPVFGEYLRMAGHVPVVAGNGRAAYEEAKRRLESGMSMAVFPEGDISPLDGTLRQPRTGVARLALCTGAPVIPVGIHLQRERIQIIETEVDGRPEVGTWYLRGPYGITVGEPLYFEGDAEDRDCVRSSLKRIMQCIVSLAHQGALRMAQRDRKAVPAADVVRRQAAGGGWIAIS